MGSESEIEKSTQKDKDRKKMQALAPIAKPLAGKKLCKRTLKLVRKDLRLLRPCIITKRKGSHEFQPLGIQFRQGYVKKGAEHKCLKRGVKEVVKSIRRGSKGLCVIAGNISPIDVITHVPVLCEEAEIPYIYVPSKEDLANAGSTKRPTCCVLVLTKPAKGEIGKEDQEQLQADYDLVAKEIYEITSAMF